MVSPDSDRAADGHQDSLRSHTRALVPPEPGAGGDLGTRLTQLCRAAVAEVDLMGAVVTLMTISGPEAVAAASDAAAQRLEELQYGVGEGPGREAFVSGRPVLIPDVDGSFSRWPGYVPQAREAGVAGVYTFPVQMGATRFGVLTCYSDHARRLGEDALAQCLVFAEMATEILLESPAGESGDNGHARLDEALHFRTEIYQAQGMVMVQMRVSLAEALARMRAHAFATERDLTALAFGIIDRSIQLPPDDE